MNRYAIIIIWLLLSAVEPLSAQWNVRMPVVTPKGFSELSECPNVIIDKRYSTPNNICRRIIDSSSSCIIREVAFKKFVKACNILSNEHSGWKFIIFDAYRTQSVQQKLWDAVKHTPRAKYVAYPKYVSMHTLGLAVDLTLADEHGTPLDMGTDFDDFTPLASPRFEKESLRTKKLTLSQYKNRLILRRLMQRAGFIQLQSEWWHYESMHEKDAHAHFTIWQ
ncbi:MAG TPA: M15 family metallopeptidase [Candidatus Kapabacteria bacterium]|nr:M15 family metallopeptidase [Candidatus Kapabacteria bacterium]